MENLIQDQLEKGIIKPRYNLWSSLVILGKTKMYKWNNEVEISS